MTEEGDWVRAACQGDAQAWEQLVQIYQQPIFRLAYLLLGDADDAEDVAQETLIRAYRSLGSFDPSRPLRPWLLRITANLSH
ncbi:MAG: RNA polymerase subunit sigma-24, partial [Chloroflexi bacterium]